MIGSSILNALLKRDRYIITVLTRSAISHNFPSSVRVIEVDYTSQDSIATALEGQDVLISAMAKWALRGELLLIETAFRMKVKRVIPSEFGSNLLDPRTRLFPNYQDKIIVQERLKLYAQIPSSTMSYTLIFNNVLLDWSLSSGLMLDPKQKVMRRYDGGNILFSTTRVSTVGRAVAAVLGNFEATANRAVYIQDICITQNELFSILREEIESLSPSPSLSTTDFIISTTSSQAFKPTHEPEVHQGWKIMEINTAEAEEKACNELAAGNTSEHLFYAFASRAAFADGFGGCFTKLDNRLLGIKEIGRDELKVVIRKALLDASVGT
jgi:hypothetical protein